MQPVSTAYKTQMKKPIRNRSYVRVSYGVFNLTAKNQAAFSDNGHIVFSQLTINDDILPDKQYITLEKNFWRADGTQFILPAAAHIIMPDSFRPFRPETTTPSLKILSLQFNLSMCRTFTD